MKKFLLPLLLLGAAPVQQNCLLLGSGVALSIAPYIPCRVVAKPEKASWQILDYAPKGNFDKVIISAGGNDPLNPKLGQNLFAIRRKYPNARVTWLAPRNSHAEERVFETATVFHDKIFYLRSIKVKDGWLPRDPKALAKKVW